MNTIVALGLQSVKLILGQVMFQDGLCIRICMGSLSSPVAYQAGLCVSWGRLYMYMYMYMYIRPGKYIVRVYTCTCTCTICTCVHVQCTCVHVQCIHTHNMPNPDCV